MLLRVRNYRQKQRLLLNVGIDGKAMQVTTPDDVPSAAAWSPDGKRIAFINGEPQGELVVIDHDGANRRLLVAEPCEGAPAWLPDGKAMIVSVRQKDGGNTDLWRVALDGTVHNLTNTVNKPECQPAVSPDGTMLSYAGDIYCVAPFMIATDVYLMGLSTLLPVKLFGFAGLPRWRPDGKALAILASRKVSEQPFENRYRTDDLIVNLHGDILKTVACAEFHALGGFGHISFAPDSTRFAYLRNGTIWLDRLE